MEDELLAEELQTQVAAAKQVVLKVRRVGSVRVCVWGVGDVCGRRESPPRLPCGPQSPPRSAHACGQMCVRVGHATR